MPDEETQEQGVGPIESLRGLGAAIGQLSAPIREIEERCAGVERDYADAQTFEAVVLRFAAGNLAAIAGRLGQLVDLLSATLVALPPIRVEGVEVGLYDFDSWLQDFREHQGDKEVADEVWTTLDGMLGVLDEIEEAEG